MDEPTLTVDDLTVRYDSTVALEAVSFALTAGGSLAVIGANGSGKSTLLHAIAGLVEPAAGRITGDRARTALVLQSTDVDPGLPITVRETVRMARYPSVGLLGRFRPTDEAAVAEAVDLMALRDLADRQLHDLSGGQRQRVLVAQGLAQDADLLLLDEPATGLDVVSREIILDVLDQVRSRGRTIVMTTHDLADAGRMERVLLLARRQIAIGTPAQVIRPDPLRAAFGGAVAAWAGGSVLMDDPHHGH